MLPSIKNFAIAFAISIIIFGTLGFVITPLLKDATSGFDATAENESGVDTSVTVPEEDENNEPSETPKINTDAESFTMLIIGTDYQPNIFKDYRVNLSENATAEDYVKNSRHYTADTIIIIRADKQTGDFLITSLPKTTKVTSHGVVTTLGEAYENVTIDYFKQLITSIISLSIDYCIEMQVNMAREVIDFMYPTGISYEVPYDMYYVNEEERVLMPGTSLDDYVYEYDENGNVINPPGTPFTIDLKRGMQRLDGEKSTHLLRYHLHNGGEEKRCEIAINFFKTIADSSFSYSDEDVLATMGGLNKIMMSTDGRTDINANDAENILEMLKNYTLFNVKTLTIPGTYKTENGKDYFEYTYSAVHNIFSSYK